MSVKLPPRDPGKLRFQAMIQPGRSGGAYVEFPFDAGELFGTRGRVPVRLEIGSGPYARSAVYRGSLVTYGGTRMVGLPKAVREEAGVDVGATASFVLTIDREERRVELPPELAEALAGDPEAAAGWEGFSYSHQREYAEAVSQAKRPETRSRRVHEALDAARARARAGTSPP